MASSSSLEFNESQAKVFQDSIHGPMKFHPLLIKIIDTPQFQRLRNVKQLGGVYYVFPAASHNRFEHSLGTCHIAGKLIEALKTRQPELDINERDVLCIKIAALCHDMGHGPFSHLYQDLFICNHKIGWKHEQASVELLNHLIDQNEGVKEALKQNGLVWDDSCEHNDKDFVKELIYGISFNKLRYNDFKGRPKKKSFLYQIVANKLNGIDVDKMDYITRDGICLGIPTSFNWSRYIEFIRVLDVDIKMNGDEESTCRLPCICSRDKMVSDLQELLHMRHRLHYNAYQHKTKRAIECMLAGALEKVKEHKLLPGQDGEMKTIIEAVDDMTAFTHLTDGIFDTIMSSESVNIEDLTKECDIEEAKNLQEAKDLIWKVQEREIFVCAHKVTVPTLHMKDMEDVSKETAAYVNANSATHGVLLKKEDIKVIGVVYNYGMDNQNPFERVWCYNKTLPNKPIKCQTSNMYPLPKKFEEVDYVVYCTKQVNQEVLDAIRKGFEKIVLPGAAGTQ